MLKAAGGLKADSKFSNILFPPLSTNEILAAEEALGFQLTPVLRRIYTETANGGFGPSYGLLGVCGGMLNEDGNDATRQYTQYRELDPNDAHWFWPEGVLPLGHLGCAMYLCVDCSRQDGPVIWFEPNAHLDGETWKTSFVPFAHSTEEWLAAWLDGNDIFDAKAEGLLSKHLSSFDCAGGQH